MITNFDDFLFLVCIKFGTNIRASYNHHKNENSLNEHESGKLLF
jgi:hypothetical protein